MSSTSKALRLLPMIGLLAAASVGLAACDPNQPVPSAMGPQKTPTPPTATKPL